MKAFKRDYFLTALAAGCYKHKRWVIEAFSVTRPNPTPAAFPMPLLRDEAGFYWMDAEKGRIDIVDGPKEGPLFSAYDEIVLEPGDMVCVRKSYVTTYGSVLANQFLLVYPFGGQFEFMDGELNPGMFDKLIEKNLSDEYSEPSSNNPISIEQNILYSNATSMLCEFTQLWVPTATRKTMTVDPRIPKRRAELMEKYKDRLHDPVVQAMIAQELIAMDREWFKGDLGEGFFFKAKSFDVVRKKLFIAQGSENGFGVQGEFIPTSLSEGWDITHFASMNNGLRDGSYNRGASTARGGEATKFFYRIFQNTRITEQDCGSPYGLTKVIDESMSRAYLGSTVIDKGKLVLLTEENIGKYMSRPVTLRSPQFCKTEGANFCACCIGRNLAVNPDAISTYAAGIGSTFMLIEMASMHGKALSVAKYKPTEHLT